MSAAWDDALTSESGAPVRDVAACVILNGEGRLLVGRRPLHKRHGGLWEFPGGKVRWDETPAEAAARELGEELGLGQVTVDPEVIFERMDVGSPFRILFLRVATPDVPEAREHDELAWIDPSTADLDLAPADAAFVAAVRAGEVDLDPG